MKKFWILAVALVGCGPGLKEQVRLTSLAVRADANCKLAAAQCPTKAPNAVILPQCQKATQTCQAALSCETDAKLATSSIQSLQVARSTGQTTPDLYSIAKQDYALAQATCSKGGWR